MERLMDLVQRTAAFLKDKGLANGRREAEWIFAETLGLQRLDLYTQFDRLLDDDEVSALRALVMRRSKREPLAYVLGNQDFHGLKLEVGPSVLVPRPETEELVEAVLKTHNEDHRSVIDVGTGSGAIALALKAARPNWEVSGCDASAQALAVARSNAKACSLEVCWQESDLLDGVDGPWDTIVANLPYVAESERDLMDPETGYEPAMALFADQQGMALMTRLIESLQSNLQAGGDAWFEHGFAQGEPLRATAQKAGFEARTHKDMAGQDRYTQLIRP